MSTIEEQTTLELIVCAVDAMNEKLDLYNEQHDPEYHLHAHYGVGPYTCSVMVGETCVWCSEEHSPDDLWEPDTLLWRALYAVDREQDALRMALFGKGYLDSWSIWGLPGLAVASDDQKFAKDVRSHFSSESDHTFDIYAKIVVAAFNLNVPASRREVNNLRPGFRSLTKQLMFVLETKPNHDSFEHHANRLGVSISVPQFRALMGAIKLEYPTLFNHFMEN